jgi:hypothetical protein
MRLSGTSCLLMLTLGANVHCSSSGGSPVGDGGVSCNGQQAVCPGHPYAACVEVQQGPGHCVDWSMLGASACSTGPQDCPTTLPSAAFPASAGASASAVCVQATDIQFTTGAASPGYCAAFEGYTDSAGTATCTPNPCGAGGYCSYLHTAAGSVVSCMWPI